MAEPGISLITYTFNDHDFARVLISCAKNFLVPFQEILIVDDASAEPFALRDAADPRIKVFRLAENAGSAHVKRHGLRQTTGSIIFSMDADIRPHAKWLIDSLPLLQDPSVGLVGASCIPARTAGYLGAALHRTFPIKRESGERMFTSGGCWLFRREVWEGIGGLDDLPADSFEDIFLCGKLRAHGYRIMHNNRFPVYETRNLHRLVHCKRTVHYNYAVVAPVVNKYGPERYMSDISREARSSLHYFSRYGDPVLSYVFLLKTAFMFYMMRKKQRIADTTGSPAPCILTALEGTPGTLAFFREDMAALGMESETLQARLPSFIPLLDGMTEAGVFAALEQKWIALYRDEDRTHRFDRHHTDAERQAR